MCPASFGAPPRIRSRTGPDGAVQGLLAGVPEERLPQVASAAAAALEEDHAAVRFLAECLPGHPVGWAAVEGLSADAAGAILERPFGLTASGCRTTSCGTPSIACLDVGRPRAALAAATYKPQRLPAEAWVRVLRALPGSGEKGPLPGSHRLTAIFEVLDKADDLSIRDVAHLELPFVRALDDRRGRVMALHRCMGADHQEYVWFLARIYGRDDDEVDPPELRVADPEFAHPLGQIAVRLLWSWRSYPAFSRTARSMRRLSWTGTGRRARWRPRWGGGGWRTSPSARLMAMPAPKRTELGRRGRSETCSIARTPPICAGAS